jgi:hypothetical protein
VFEYPSIDSFLKARKLCPLCSKSLYNRGVIYTGDNITYKVNFINNGGQEYIFTIHTKSNKISYNEINVEGNYQGGKKVNTICPLELEFTCYGGVFGNSIGLNQTIESKISLLVYYEKQKFNIPGNITKIVIKSEQYFMRSGDKKYMVDIINSKGNITELSKYLKPINTIMTDVFIDMNKIYNKDYLQTKLDIALLLQ